MMGRFVFGDGLNNLGPLEEVDPTSDRALDGRRRARADGMPNCVWAKCAVDDELLLDPDCPDDVAELVLIDDPDEPILLLDVLWPLPSVTDDGSRSKLEKPVFVEELMTCNVDIGLVACGPVADAGLNRCRPIPFMELVAIPITIPTTSNIKGHKIDKPSIEHDS